MIEKQSKQIRQFYLAYKQWLDAGAQSSINRTAFKRELGLCLNLDIYCYFHLSYTFGPTLRDEMRQQFKAFGLDMFYPFHYENKPSYLKECQEQLCHLNPDRIEWVTMMCEVPSE